MTIGIYVQLIFLVLYYFVAGFFVAGAFLAAGFFAAGFVAFALGADFLTVVVGLILVAFAIFATAALRREAVFFLSRPFLTALSYSDWTLLAFSALGDFLKSLSASLIFFLIWTFFAVRLVA